ncbi:MAG: zinc ribbon domain-containing protein [Candidatus Hydrothermarchaeaceae archaeon]
MTASGTTLMQIENEKRRTFKRVVSAIAGLPVLGVGVALLYFGYSETDYLYLFLYFALGLTVTLFGFMLMMSGLPARGKKFVIGSEIAASMQKEQEGAKAPEGKCPECGSKIVSAGKFCGNCGQPLD